jgi:ABC-type glutathione transport system ATPase component
MQHPRRGSIPSKTPALYTGAGDATVRTFSDGTNKHQHNGDETHMSELDDGDADSVKTSVEEWRLAEQVKDVRQNDQAESRKLGVTWKDLTVKVMPADSQLQENVFSQFNYVQQIKESRQKPQLRTILESTSGHVAPGEMLLVLGKPGSGCTTLLKMLANKRKGFNQIEGDVHFGSLDYKAAG